MTDIYIPKCKQTLSAIHCKCHANNLCKQHNKIIKIYFTNEHSNFVLNTEVQQRCRSLFVSDINVLLLLLTII